MRNAKDMKAFATILFLIVSSCAPAAIAVFDVDCDTSGAGHLNIWSVSVTTVDESPKASFSGVTGAKEQDVVFHFTDLAFSDINQLHIGGMTYNWTSVSGKNRLVVDIGLSPEAQWVKQANVSRSTVNLLRDRIEYKGRPRLDEMAIALSFSLPGQANAYEMATEPASLPKGWAIEQGPNKFLQNDTLKLDPRERLNVYIPAVDVVESKIPKLRIIMQTKL